MAILPSRLNAAPTPSSHSAPTASPAPSPTATPTAKPHPSASATPAGPFANLDFRTIGPIFGRIDTVSGVAGNPKIYFAGGLGGLLRSMDGGATWQEVFTRKPVSSIGAVAIAPSNAKIVYVGTGEPNLRSDIAFGDGVWRSDDGGDTWRHIGLEGTSQISSIVIDHNDANTVLVGAVGDPYRASADRGVYKTTDGGAHWRQVLFAGTTTGASSIVAQPGNPSLLFAGMWQVFRRPYLLSSGGSDGGLFKSTDGGEHWQRQIGHGLPNGVTGRIGLAFAPGSPARLYALIESRSGVLWRSEDAGETWRLISSRHLIGQRPFYFSQLSVDPRDANHVYFLSVSLLESKDGGVTVKRMRRTPGGDNHQMWIDPNDGDRSIVGNDQGLMLTQNAGTTWTAPPLLVAQSYHVAVDDRVPYTVCSENQDSGAWCGPSNDLIFPDIEPDDWIPPGGGESGWIVFDRTNDNIIYGDSYEGFISAYDRRTNQVAGILVWPEDTSGWGAAALKYRFQWSAPIATAAWNPKAVYFGGNHLFITYNKGVTWQAISPDLTRNNKAWQQHSGGPITGDNTGPEVYDTIFTIAASPLRAGLLWIGSDDGLAWLTYDDGKHWTQVTPRGVGMPQYGRIDYIDPSPHDPAVAYMAVEDHERGDRTPYLYRTTDYGRTWHPIASNLPPGSYARIIKEDPVRRGLLYAGTETGLWLSFNDGGSWQQLHDNFPTVPVYDLVVQPRFDDLVVGTHGLSNLVLDDMRPIQDFGPAVTSRSVFLFETRPAYRYADTGTGTTSPGSGANPNYGVDINFYLRKAPSSKQKIKVEILRGNRIIRTMNVSDATSGINRTWWDLTYDGLSLAKDVAVPPTFSGPLAVPGKYSVRLIAAGTTLSRPITVLPDPRSPATQAALQAQLDFLLRIRDDLSRIGRSINALRDAMKAADKAKSQAGSRTAAPTLAAIADFNSQVSTAENALYQPADIEGEDSLREPIHSYEKLNSLAGIVNTADVAPRPADIEELNTLESQARAGMALADKVLTSGLRALNATLTHDGIAPVRVHSP